MSVEHNEPNHISFEEVISKSKETLLQTGHHKPILILDDIQRLITVEIGIQNIPPTHGEALDLFRFLGQATAKSGTVQKLRQVFMVSEAWLTLPKDDDGKQKQASQTPHRVEVLIIAGLQIKENTRQTKILEIIKNNDAKAVQTHDLEPARESEDKKTLTPLLDAFVDGFQTAHTIRYN